MKRREMQQRRGIGIPGLGLTMALMAALTGCGPYAVTFQVADVINDGGKGRNAAQMLDVDVVALTGEDVGKYPDLANGSKPSGEWFKLRQDGTTRLAPKQIYSLRSESSRLTGDTRMGEPLVSARDTASPTRTLLLENQTGGIHTLLVYGRFFDGQSKLPLIVSGPALSDRKVTIAVGSQSMQVVEEKK